MKTRISTREYTIAHCHAPRGWGRWAFAMYLANGQRVDRDDRGWECGIYWVTAKYGDAKRAALREGRRILAAVVSVGS
jgi:hypothetical protein